MSSTNSEIPVRGYIIVDNKTNALDWDGDLHHTREAAIESLCGPRQMYVRTPDEADPDGDKIAVYWADHYDICKVTDIQ